MKFKKLLFLTLTTGSILLSNFTAFANEVNFNTDFSIEGFSISRETQVDDQDLDNATTYKSAKFSIPAKTTYINYYFNNTGEGSVKVELYKVGMFSDSRVGDPFNVDKNDEDFRKYSSPSSGKYYLKVLSNDGNNVKGDAKVRDSN